MAMTNDPTPDEIARAKRWAALQTPPVRTNLVQTGYSAVVVIGLPNWVRIPRGRYGDDTAVWSALALALRPVFNSVGPVIREECAAVTDRMSVQCDKRPEQEPISEQYSCLIADKYRYAAAELRDASLLIRELK